MRRFISLACLIALTAAPAMAGDGQVSARSLARMGLNGMKVVSDSDGSRIRGLSFAFAGSAAFGGTTILSINSPFSVGNHFAFSAQVVVSSGSFAGGAASASAH
jgi:hypothetical protein